MNTTDPMDTLASVVGDDWSDLLESICDDVWNDAPDRYHLTIHRSDVINCVASGDVEIGGTVYEFQLAIGESPGLLAFGENVGAYKPPEPEEYTFVPRRHIGDQPLAWRIRDAWAADPKSEANRMLAVLNSGPSYDAFFAPSLATRAADREVRSDADAYFVRISADVIPVKDLDRRRREQLGDRSTP